VVGGGGEVPGVGRAAEVAEPGIELGPGGGAEGGSEAVTDPLEHGHVTGHSGEIVGCSVDAQLLAPEPEAAGVDLGGGR